MATTSYGVNHPLAVKHWSKRLFREALKQTYFRRFMGTGTNSLIQIKQDTQKEAGDRIRCGLRMQLTGSGIRGDDTLEGNEEALVTYTDDVMINQLRHAVRSAGKMSEQRVPFSVREEARVGLTDWWADRYDESVMNHLGGAVYKNTDLRYCGNNSIDGTTATRIVYAPATAGDHSTDASLSTTDTFRLESLDFAVEVAKTASPLIRPIRVNGGDYYVAFLHPYQVTDLRTNTSTGQWLDIQKAAMQGGMVTKSPIFTGALGMYNGVVLHESTRVPDGVSTSASISDVRRAILCGAQSAIMAFGQGYGDASMKWEEELFDYGNQLGVAAGSIWGVKKANYNSTDFGTVVMPTYAVAHGKQ